MANWYGTARSNYFRVKDIAAFTAAIEMISDIKIIHGSDEDPTGSVALFETSGEGWANPTCDVFDGDDEHGDACRNCEEPEAAHQELSDLVAKHLIDGDVAIFIESGAEKSRYVTGRAIAVNNRGGRVQVDLNDIYELAEALGSTVTRAEY